MAPETEMVNPARFKSSQTLMWNAKCSELLMATLEPCRKRRMVTKMTKARTGMTTRLLVTKRVLKLMISIVVFKQFCKIMNVSSKDEDDSLFILDITGEELEKGKNDGE